VNDKELAHAYRWAFDLQHLRGRVQARSLKNADWQKLATLLDRIHAGDDVRAYYHGHAMQEKGAARRRDTAEAARRRDMQKLVAAARSLLSDATYCAPLPKVAKKAGIPLRRVRRLTTKRELQELLDD
jgi:hypothetical protein